MARTMPTLAEPLAARPGPDSANLARVGRNSAQWIARLADPASAFPHDEPGDGSAA